MGDNQNVLKKDALGWAKGQTEDSLLRGKHRGEKAPVIWLWELSQLKYDSIADESHCTLKPIGNLKRSKNILLILCMKQFH